MAIPHVIDDLAVICRLMNAVQTEHPAAEQLGQLEDAVTAYAAEFPSAGISQLIIASRYVARMIMLAHGMADEAARLESTEFSMMVGRRFPPHSSSKGHRRRGPEAGMII